MRGKLNVGVRVKDGRPIMLPIDTVTGTLAVLGIKGSGKTVTSGVVCEEMLECGLQTVILDPVDVWWGLKSSASGKQAGYPIIVFGGEHGDLPLDPGAAHLVADLIVEERISAVICTADFSKTQQRKFVTAFAERLYYQKRKTKFQTPMHLAVDECDEFIPQKVMAEEAPMVGAMDRIVRRGRKRGIGITLISQRPAVVNKNVLSQVQLVVTMRLVGKWDLKALEDWIKYHGAQEQQDEFMRTVPSLKVGEAWFWSPGWLRLFARVQVRPRRTFDSSATPKVGQRLREPKRLSRMDLDSIRERMQEVVERAEQDDPAKLRRRIAELQRQVKAKAPRAVHPQFDAAAVNKLIIGAVNDAIGERDLFWVKQLKAVMEGLGSATTTLRKIMARTVDGGFRVKLPKLPSVLTARPTAQPLRRSAPVVRRPPSSPGEVLPIGERKILTILAQRTPALTTKAQLAVFTGYSVRSGSFSNYQSALRTQGYIEGRAQLLITDAGVAALGDFTPLPSGPALIEYWRQQLKGGAPRKVFDVLVDAYPDRLSKEEIAERAGYTLSGSFSNACSRLRTLELAEGKQEMQASDLLFE